MRTKYTVIYWCVREILVVLALATEAGGLALNQQLRPSSSQIFEDCGHLLMLERPNEVTATIDLACSYN